MSKNPGTHLSPMAKTNVARKRYAAPVLEAYGTVQELTRTGATYSDGSDFSTYFASTPPT